MNNEPSGAAQTPVPSKRFANSVISSLLRVESARIILEGSLARLSERESESESRGCASTDLGAAALPREGCLLLPEANVSPGALPGVAAQPRRTFHQGVAKGKK